MGLRLFAEVAGPPWPVPIVVEMTCDGDHGLFAPAMQRFPCPTVVYRFGWLERSTADGRKLWLGPCCSGKVAAPRTAAILDGVRVAALVFGLLLLSGCSATLPCDGQWHGLWRCER